MAKSRTVREPDQKKISSLEKLHEKNASLKDKQMKLREQILAKTVEMRELIQERHALADEITRTREEALTTEPGSRSVVDATAVTQACCTPDYAASGRKAKATKE